MTWPSLSSAFVPQKPEGCTCAWSWQASGKPARSPDPGCPADHQGRADPRQRMRGLRDR